jgi:hypothetical protein
MFYKTIKNLYFLVPIVLIIVQISLHFTNLFFDNVDNNILESFHESIFVILVVFSNVNWILIIISLIIRQEKKKPLIIHLGLEILEFIILDIIIALILSIIIWYNRDKNLIEIANINNFTFGYVFKYLVFSVLIVSYLIVLIINMKKSLKINRNICILLFPIKYIILFIFFLFLGGFESLCPWDPLIDTEYSSTFNIYNISKLEERMPKEYIESLIGEPLRIYVDKKEGVINLKYTNDGKCNYGDYAWFDFQLNFKNNILIKKIIRWNYD